MNTARDLPRQNKRQQYRQRIDTDTPVLHRRFFIEVKFIRAEAPHLAADTLISRGNNPLRNAYKC